MYRIFGCLLSFLALEFAARAALPSIDELTEFLMPVRTDQAVLSTDGKRIAYTVRQGQRLSLLVSSVDDLPVRRSVDICQVEGRDAQKLAFLEWADENRVVYALRRENRDEVWVLDAATFSTRRLNTRGEFDILYSPPPDPDPEHDKPETFDTSATMPEEIPLPRYPRCMRLSPLYPGCVVLMTEGSVLQLRGRESQYEYGYEYQLWKVPLDGSPKKSFFRGTYPRRPLFDRQFVPRLVQQQPPGQAALYLGSVGSSVFSKQQTVLSSFDEKTQESFRVTPANYFGPRSVLLSFGKEPTTLYYASNVERDCMALYQMNLRTGKRRVFELPSGVGDFVSPTVSHGSDQGLVFDRFSDELVGLRFTETEQSTLWIDPSLGAVQQELQNQLQGRVVQVLSWDRERKRFLAFVSSPNDPGRYFVFDREASRLTQFAKAMPWFDLDQVNLTDSLTVSTPVGVRLSAYLTTPRAPLLKPPPLVILLHDAPWTQTTAAFNRDAQILARFGFLVLRLNYRGSDGGGRNLRDALFSNYERAPYEDLEAALGALEKVRSFDKRRVVLFGTGFGGYLAARACQLYPDKYRCAVAWNSPVDPKNLVETQLERARDTMMAKQAGMLPFDYMDRQLRNYNQLGADPSKSFSSPPQAVAFKVNFMSEVRRYVYQGDGRRPPVSLLADERGLSKPMLFLQDSDHPILGEDQLKSLRRRMAKNGVELDYLLFDADDNADSTTKRVRAYARIVEFLNETVYNYDVKIGPTEVRP